MKLSEHQLLLREGRKIVRALGAMLAPLVEIVLHDLTKPDQAIVEIANNLSGRKPGDKVTEVGLARCDDPDFPEVLQNYPNRFPDGRPAKSTSIGLKDSKGRYVAAICLNMDVALLNSATASLLQLAHTGKGAPLAESLAPCRLADVRGAIEKFAAAHNTTPRGLSLGQRCSVVRELVDSGILDIKNGVAEIAGAFGVARSTVYTYLPDKRTSA
jgi:predicted transcriptional regulator YheO